MSISYLSKTNLKKWQGKTALLRVDLNVNGTKDNFRLAASIPTIKFLLKNGVKVVILSHKGRPNKQSTINNKQLSLKKFVKIFEKKLKTKVKFISDLENAKKQINMTEVRLLSYRNRVILLENLRFWKGEEENDAKFAKVLATLGDIYVNDAFAVSHRANASVSLLPKYLPHFAGLLMEKEMKQLNFGYFKKPLVMVLGGEKLRDKMKVIKYLYKKTDYFLLGSAIANNGGLFKKFGKKVIFPSDLCFDKSGKALDVGKDTIAKYGEIIAKAKTIIWNGPLGDIENKNFQFGTKEIIKAILKNKHAKVIIGGGETVNFFQKLINNKPLTINQKKIFLSTGGGAMIAYLAGDKLPGIEILKK